MNRWKEAMVALICFQGVLKGDYDSSADTCEGCAVGEVFYGPDYTECEEQEGDDPGQEALCEEEYWCREICYEPMYYTTQKCVEKQVPVKKLCCKMVPKEYTVQRMRYVPQMYTEKVVKNELQYFYQDDWKITTQTVAERQCEWVPRFVWKKVTKDSCITEETQQDD